MIEEESVRNVYMLAAGYGCVSKTGKAANAQQRGGHARTVAPGSHWYRCKATASEWVVFCEASCAYVHPICRVHAETVLSVQAVHPHEQPGHWLQDVVEEGLLALKSSSSDLLVAMGVDVPDKLE